MNKYLEKIAFSYIVEDLDEPGSYVHMDKAEHSSYQRHHVSEASKLGNVIPPVVAGALIGGAFGHAAAKFKPALPGVARHIGAAGGALLGAAKGLQSSSHTARKDAMRKLKAG